jgi:hypothetical protein
MLKYLSKRIVSNISSNVEQKETGVANHSFFYLRISVMIDFDWFFDGNNITVFI